MQRSQISSYFHDFSKEQTMILEVFPDDDIGFMTHDRKKVESLQPQEIVYPCIPDPDGEDKGGQASSSLAVSTRWIFAAKLLQSDLATLAQREGGE
ncbi:hypothetical protein GW17_00045862 [Ensete ventricosum]|nr:hypothetical protein GW17_00045862 [Ensete ventricosum]